MSGKKYHKLFSGLISCFLKIKLQHKKLTTYRSGAGFQAEAYFEERQGFIRSKNQISFHVVMHFRFDILGTNLRSGK